jgi:membrane-bound metal-dependent hydrolase YbcI (DUF457 family)
MLATLLPDIDTPKSKIRIYTSVTLALIITGYLIISFSISSAFIGVIGFFLSYLIIRFFPTKHRGITHELWFSLMVALLLNFFFWLMFRFSGFEFGLYYLVILWGYLSHLILDNFF